ncbi:MAG: hypothetical protein PHY16_04125 [Methylobacter sp.]|nr:hypothetical protein [Methylobacter sp.]
MAAFPWFEWQHSLEYAIMVSLGKDESEIHAKAIKFKQHDETTLKASFDFFDDEPELVNFMRT